MDNPIRYATASDGVAIAYHVMGAGPPLVIAPPVPWSNVKAELDFDFLRSWWERHADWSTVVRYDCRGTGLSDRSSVDFSLQAQIRDLAAVVDALALESFALLAPFVGTPAAVAYAAEHPERVTHLLLWHPFLDGASLYPAFEAYETIATEHWDTFTETFAHGIVGWQHGDAAHRYATYLRTCVTQEAFVSARPIYASLDATAFAAGVRAPTLVATRRGLPEIAVTMARDAANRIPGARFVLMEGTSAVPHVGDGDAVLSLFRRFVTEQAPAGVSPPTTPTPLTERETEVLSLLAGGRTGREIAESLGISLSTAQRHIANIYGKIGARGRVDAAAYALARGLVTPRE